jgi:hypothetical protein
MVWSAKSGAGRQSAIDECAQLGQVAALDRFWQRRHSAAPREEYRSFRGLDDAPVVRRDFDNAPCLITQININLSVEFSDAEMYALLAALKHRHCLNRLVCFAEFVAVKIRDD